MSTETGLAERIAQAITETAGDDLLSCTRVWEAWSYGTMGPDDFTSLGEDPDVLHDIVQAVLAVLPGHRTITTVEELDALPRGAVVACISHSLNLPMIFVFQRGSHNAMGWGWTTPDTEGQIESADVFEFIALNGFPTTFTVLVEPDYGGNP